MLPLNVFSSPTYNDFFFIYVLYISKCCVMPFLSLDENTRNRLNMHYQC